MKGTKVKAKHVQQESTTANAAIADAEDFNFDLWARAVKQQMLAVLREKA